MTRYLFIVFLLFHATFLFAGGYNSYQFIIGERASGMGGAFTALADDSSALWYNPAGIADISMSHLNLSADAYTYAVNDFVGFNQFEHYDGTIDSIDLKMKDMSIAPTTLVYGKKLKGTGSLAFGLVVPVSTSLEGEIAGNFQDISNSVEYVSHLADSMKLQIGMIGWGTSLGEKLNIGASLGLGYGSLILNKSDSYYVYKNNTVEITKDENIYSTLKMVSAQLALGFQYSSKNHHWGLNIQTPTLRLYNMTSIDSALTTSLVVSNVGTNTFTSSSTEDNFFSLIPIFPGRIVLGYAFIQTNSWALSIDAELILPLNILKIYGVSVNRKTVLNLKLGTEIYLSPKYILRAGLYTDLSPTIDIMSSTDNDTKINYYGITLAFAYKQGLRYFSDNADKPGEMWTSFGLTYRLGLGEFKSVIFDTDLQKTYEARKTASHDVGIFIAKSISY